MRNCGVPLRLYLSACSYESYERSLESDDVDEE